MNNEIAEPGRALPEDNQMEWWERDGGVEFLRGIGLRHGQSVLDFGCRVGHYTIPAAKAVGNDGIVYAVDKEWEALSELGRKVAFHNLTNVRAIETSGQLKLPLESGVVDVALLYDVLHYFVKDERVKLYQEVSRVLKENGLLSIYPKHTEEDSPTREFQHLRSTDVRREIQGAGFQFERRYCALLSHDDELNKGCVLNFIKSGGNYENNNSL